MNTGGNKYIAFFVGSEKSAIGGMETHAKYFYNHFLNNKQLKCVITREFVWDCEKNRKTIYSSYEEMMSIIKKLDVQILFFNDGYWIEKYISIRTDNRNIVMIMRSGGNEFMKAPVHDMSISIFERRNIWAKAINSLNYIISNSSYTTHRMVDIGIKKEKVVMIRGGVNVEQCNEYSKKKVELRQALLDEYKLSPNTCVLGIVSRFEKFKGIEKTIEALSLISNVKWHLFIAGSGPEKNSILCKLKNYLNTEQYTVLGQLNIKQSLRLIASLDYLLNLSLEFSRKSGNEAYIHTETMGRSMIEAVCCKTPIIATNVGGISELFLEQGKIGIILEKNKLLAKEIEKMIQKKADVFVKEIEKYDWTYIFDNLYVNLMSIEEKYHHNRNLIIDLEGSIIHDFCSEEINRQNLERILSLSNICNVIINTAGELDNIFMNYPYVNAYKDNILIIANCGKKVLLYGQDFIFLRSYYDSLHGPDEKLVKKIKKYIESKGGNVTKITEVDKLYINYKVSDINEDVIEGIKIILKDTPYKVCKNSNNIKIISEEIEKGNTLRFICHHILKTNVNIGVGNGVLDMSFLNLCQTAYFINQSLSNTNYICVDIKSSLDMEKFIGALESDVKKESTYNNG